MVVDLILDMKKRGHPSFVQLDEAQVKANAAELPEDGVPPEVVQVINAELGAEDGPLDSKLQPQKAAAPREAPELDAATAGATFAMQRPRSVVAEGRAARDAHEAEHAALENMVAELKSDGIRTGLETFEVRAGNQLIDMFRACYFAIAFCFLFTRATAEPDVINAAAANQEEGTAAAPSRRKKKDPEAPEVGILAWGAAILRQAASQFRRDWNFAPALWNFIFRTKVNLMPNAYMHAIAREDGRGVRPMTPQEIEQGTQEIYRMLRNGIYVDINNENKAVNGDFTKLRYCPGLSLTAQKLLTNAEARARHLPGTHAVRSTMRHQTHAYRVNYGVSTFITFSPSERDSALMVRLVRARTSDPAIASDDGRTFYDREKPVLTEEFFRLSPESLAEVLQGFRVSVNRRSSFVPITYIQIHTDTHRDIQIHTDTYRYIHTYTYIHIHTYIHTYIYIYICITCRRDAV